MSENRKLPLLLHDGLTIETVWYGHATLCLSSQAGCVVGCPFCASGSRGLLRNLTCAELIAQVGHAQALGYQPQRLTLSGIGEPLHNFVAVQEFLLWCRQQRLPLSLTTCGASLPALEQLLKTEHNGVMLSLHAATAETHRQLLPHGPDFTALCALLDRLLPTLPRRRRRKLGINYLLLAESNDRDRDCLALIALLQRWPDVTVHLLACNERTEAPQWRTDPQQLQAWHATLSAAGIDVRRPNRWRVQRDGGCGTLFVRSLTDDYPHPSPPKDPSL